MVLSAYISSNFCRLTCISHYLTIPPIDLDNLDIDSNYFSLGANNDVVNDEHYDTLKFNQVFCGNRDRDLKLFKIISHKYKITSPKG